MRTGLVVAAVLFAMRPPSAQAEGEAAPKVDFLQGEAARSAIADESLEPYFSLLRPSEMAAKTGRPLDASDLTAQREECRERFRDGVRAFDKEEKAAIRQVVETVHRAWAKHYPRIADLPWSFLGIEDALEGGFPHTRGRSIVIPRSVGSAIVAAVRIGGASLHRQVALLVHEQSHVLQRLEPALFVPLYTRDWGFLRAEKVSLHPRIEPRHVVNPDGVRTVWVFPIQEQGSTVHLHPLVAFREGSAVPRMPHDMQMIGVEVVESGSSFSPKSDADGDPVVRELPAVGAYRDRFAGIFENFHPNEIFAVHFARLVVHDHFEGPGLSRPSPVLGKDWEKLRVWSRQAFAAAAPAAKK